jgi:hypothetical protein
MEMNRQSIVRRFQTVLTGGADFALAKHSDCNFDLKSQKCTITFVFEKHEIQYSIYVSEPSAPQKDRMKLLLLRYIRGAKEATGESGSPEYYADIFNRYFQDIISGDFSVREEYERLKEPFFTLLVQAKRLPESDPVRKKVENYDISWLDDFQKRQMKN